jgi:hypothetical protein
MSGLRLMCDTVAPLDGLHSGYLCRYGRIAGVRSCLLSTRAGTEVAEST